MFEQNTNSVTPSQRYVIKYFLNKTKIIKTLEVVEKSTALAKKEFERLTKQKSKTIFKIIKYQEN